VKLSLNSRVSETLCEDFSDGTSKVEMRMRHLRSYYSRKEVRHAKENAAVAKEGWKEGHSEEALKEAEYLLLCDMGFHLGVLSTRLVHSQNNFLFFFAQEPRGLYIGRHNERCNEPDTNCCRPFYVEDL
jgi:hypothetical protein